MTSPIPAEPLSYSRPEPRQGARIWAGIAILFGGIALLVIGGCFLVGVMFMLTDGPFGANTKAAGAGPQFFLGLLYTLAFASFAAGVWVFVIGLIGLLRVLNAR